MCRRRYIYKKAIQEKAKETQRYLKYNHHFSWSSGPFTMHVKVDGKVPIVTTKVALTAKHEYKDELFLEQVSGSGNIPITGQIKIITQDMKCDCRMNSSLLVKVTGITRYVANKQYEPEQKLNLKPDETWYIGTKWHCKCNKPAYSHIMSSNLSRMPMKHVDSFKDHTLEFYGEQLCSNQYYEADFTDPTKLGKGSYRWTLFIENLKDPSIFGASPLPFDENSPPPPPCNQIWKGKIGPPLETIHPKAQEWLNP